MLFLWILTKVRNFLTLLEFETCIGVRRPVGDGGAEPMGDRINADFAFGIVPGTTCFAVGPSLLEMALRVAQA
jgi:hypothetical protein